MQNVQNILAQSPEYLYEYYFCQKNIFFLQTFQMSKGS